MSRDRPLGAVAKIVAPLAAAIARVRRRGRAEAQGKDGGRHSLAPVADGGDIHAPPLRAIPTLAPQPFSVGSVSQQAGADTPAEGTAPAGQAARRKRRLPGWLTFALYLGFLAAVVVLTPRVLAWVLDSQYPIASVTSSSMWPTLRKGDLIFIQGVDELEDLNEGDIIAFEHPSGFAIHRIIAIDGETIVTQGDANAEPDEPITFDEVIGRALTIRGRLAKVPYLGNIPLLFGRSSEEDAGQAEPPLFEGEQEGASGTSASD